ncbi:MAG: cell division protein FtsZ [Methanomassiliicoccales archaeon]|nr:cell division protein FtsZ [Methanomassiliicoccales archaeon]
MWPVSWEYVEDEDIEKDLRQLKILVIGCGGGGCNSINRLNDLGLKGAETIAINTDRRHLARIKADKRLLIGASLTKGFGAGGDPELGRVCAENAFEPLNEILCGADLTFVIAGLGGGTGTGSAPVVADLARRNGSLVFSIATMPFECEGRRVDIATRGLWRLEEFSDTLLILDNNRLLEMVPHLPVDQAFGVMDQLISEIVKGITEAITEPSLINIDFSDLRAIFRQRGISTVLYGENSDPDSVVKDALSNPFLDIDFTGATGALIHITGGSNLTLKRVTRVVEGITAFLDPQANVILGARVDDDCEGVIRVIAIITGIEEVDESGDLETVGGHLMTVY